jgi:hypothetical protein
MKMLTAQTRAEWHRGNPLPEHPVRSKPARPTFRFLDTRAWRLHTRGVWLLVAACLPALFLVAFWVTADELGMIGWGMTTAAVLMVAVATLSLWAARAVENATRNRADLNAAAEDAFLAFDGVGPDLPPPAAAAAAPVPTGPLPTPAPWVGPNIVWPTRQEDIHESGREYDDYAEQVTAEVADPAPAAGPARPTRL